MMNKSNGRAEYLIKLQYGQVSVNIKPQKDCLNASACLHVNERHSFVYYTYTRTQDAYGFSAFVCSVYEDIIT